MLRFHVTFINMLLSKSPHRPNMSPNQPNTSQRNGSRNVRRWNMVRVGYTRGKFKLACQFHVVCVLFVCSMRTQRDWGFWWNFGFVLILCNFENIYSPAIVQSIYENYWHNLKQIATEFFSVGMHSREVS